MYKKTAIAVKAYISLIIPTIKTFDATTDFEEADNYASFFIISTPISPFENLSSQSIKDAETKTFTYTQTYNLDIKIVFRGSECYSNMTIFEDSFLKDEAKLFLKEAGFGYFGLGTSIPFPSNRASKVKDGMTVSLKLVGSKTVTDESQIIHDFSIKVSKL